MVAGVEVMSNRNTTTSLNRLSHSHGSLEAQLIERPTDEPLGTWLPLPGVRPSCGVDTTVRERGRRQGFMSQKGHKNNFNSFLIKLSKFMFSKLLNTIESKKYLGL